MNGTRVLLVESHRELGSALREVLEAQTGVFVVGEAGSGAEALELARRHHPDIALVDGLEPAEALHREFPTVAVLVLSMHVDGRYVARAIEAGARGYVLKQTVEQDLAPALERVLAGQQFLSPGVRAQRVSTV
ncbi:MAG: response regulator transcription factor [Bryobacteraceae bacterium]